MLTHSVTDNLRGIGTHRYHVTCHSLPLKLLVNEDGLTAETDLTINKFPWGIGTCFTLLIK